MTDTRGPQAQPTEKRAYAVVREGPLGLMLVGDSPLAGFQPGDEVEIRLRVAQGEDAQRAERDLLLRAMREKKAERIRDPEHGEMGIRIGGMFAAYQGTAEYQENIAAEAERVLGLPATSPMSKPDSDHDLSDEDVRRVRMSSGGASPMEAIALAREVQRHRAESATKHAAPVSAAPVAVCEKWNAVRPNFMGSARRCGLPLPCAKHPAAPVEPAPSKCGCHLEAGDSECFVHGADECGACGAKWAIDPTWRWNGKGWEHKCPGLPAQAGHFPAKPKAPHAPGATPEPEKLGEVWALRAAVGGCADCCLCGVVEFQIGSQAICQHPESRRPDSRFRAVSDEDERAPDESPDWCPLRTSPLTVQLRAAPSTAAPTTKVGED